MVEASTKSTRISVSSASTRTVDDFIPNSRRSNPKGLAIMPTDTNTIAAEIGDRSDRREKSPYTRINRAAKIRIGYSCTTASFHEA
jgi:hypothetical protein